MVIVVTGMVGVDKKAYLEKVCGLAVERGKDVLLCNVGDMMYAEAPDVAKGHILDLPLKRLNSLRRSVFKDIIAKARQAENVIVNTHATFRWRHGLFPAVDFDQVRRLGPDFYICLVDGVDALHLRLTSEHSIRHSLKDLLVWREEEVLGTEMLCRGISEKAVFYCLARGRSGETAGTFYDLVFRPERKKAYLSFPMTHVVNMPDISAAISNFRERMKEVFVCFDPGNLEETYLPYYAHRAAAGGRDTIEVETLGTKVRFDVAEVLQIERDINSQIYARDFMLIDQADMIISFIPALPGGRAVISSGVERELQHAHEAGKKVFVIWTAGTRPSVFVTQTATHIFDSVAAAVEFFKDDSL